MTTRNKILLGIVGAAAAGVIVGLLIAPEKGKDIRKKIKRTAGDWADNLTQLWAKGKDFADEKLGKAKENYNKAKENYS